jgi:hypothetical protein
MRGRGLMVRAGIRQRRTLLAALAVTTALACGFTLTAATGARRVATAWDRLSGRTLAPQALAEVDSDSLGEARAVISARDDVDGVGAFSYLPIGVVDIPSVADLGMFAGYGPGFGTDVLRPLVDEGRLFDPSRADEVLINRPFAELAGVSVGQRVHLAGPAGIEQDATIVGIERSPLEIGPNGGQPGMLGTPALTQRWLPALQQLEGFQVVRPVVGMHFRAHADVDAALTELRRDLPARSTVIDSDALEDDIRDGVEAGTNAFWLLALASGLGSVVLLGSLAIRAMRTNEHELRILGAIGATRRDRALALWAPAATAIVAGVAVAPIVAASASPWVRIGFARVADPETGGWFDGRTLVGGTAVLAAVLLLVAGVAAVATARRTVGLTEDRRPRRRRVASIAWLPPTVAVGASAAFGGATASARRASRSTALATGLAIACVVAALVWRSSESHLIDDPRLQGWSFDGDTSAVAAAGPSAVEAAGADLEASDLVEALVEFRQVVIPFEDAEIDVYTLTDRKRSIVPVLTAGRMATGPNEVVIGRALADLGHHQIGEVLELPGPDGAVPVTIVGEAVFPLIGNTTFGLHAIIGPETAALVQPEALNGGFLIDLAPGASLDDVRAIIGDGFTTSAPFSPPHISRLRDVRGIAVALIAFFAAFGVAGFAFGMASSSRQQAREHAVLGALGFRRRQLVTAVAVQAIVAAAVEVLIGTPLGVSLGRSIWSLTERDLGVLDAFRVPAPAIALTVAVALAAAVIMSPTAAVPAARGAVARRMRAE